MSWRPRSLVASCDLLTTRSQGPIAVPAHKTEKVLRVQTHVNGELRQNATTEDLIFSIPYLIMTMSEGQTLMPGDVLATGTVSPETRRDQAWSELYISSANISQCSRRELELAAAHRSISSPAMKSPSPSLDSAA
jgi:2-keto-4-pentenoate hydratase/2-oxohepta-3-ene-1,7-dioic acid hydratase in catechol pathway